MKVLKNIISVAFSNITNFGTSFIIGFILPAILSVADYGYYREYSLYISFAYLFNLGFNDGIYIKYGGKTDNELNLTEVNQEHNFIIVFQTLVLIVMLGFSFFMQDVILALFSLATFFISLNTYHQNFLQAVGEFSVFSKANILKSIFYVLILLVATLVFKSSNYLVYIILNICSLIFIFIFYEGIKNKKYGWNTDWNIKGKTSIFKIGIFILLANMSLTFVGNVGNWVVNWGFSIEDFAQYSFQNSILNVMLLIINAVGMVFYNIIAKHKEISIQKAIKEISLLLGVLSGLAYFIFAFIINKLLNDYSYSISMLSVTFIAIPYIMTSKILIANLYKSTKSEKKYFKDSIVFATLSFSLVLSVSFLTKNMILIALATTICYIFWYAYCIFIEFKYLRGNIKEVILLVTHVLWFSICSNIFSITLGFVCYAIYLILILMMYRKELKGVISTLTTTS